MTDEYKKQLLKYLTGNYPENYEYYPIAKKENDGTITNDLGDYLLDAFGGTSTINGQLHSEAYELIILYGNRRLMGANYGFLLITDMNYNPIQLITQYDSGTELQEFYTLALDEKNQIYGIDRNVDTQKYRFIMLNNLFANSEAKLRQSYELPNAIQNMSSYKVTKNPNSANYLIAGIIFQGNVNQPKVAKLTINVGSTNEWVYYAYSGTLLGADSELSNIYADWSEEQVQFKITAFSQFQFLVYSSWYYNDSTLIDVELYDVGAGGWTMSTIYSSASIIADIDTIYYTVHANTTSGEELLLFAIQDGTQQLIDEYGLTDSQYDDVPGYYLSIENGVLMYSRITPRSTQYYYDVVAGFYKESPTFFVSEQHTLMENIEIYTPLHEVLNSFNLYQFNIQSDNTLYYGKFLYNQNINFSNVYDNNGSISPTDMKPRTIGLYENNEILFNRNLYNLVSSGSTTTATVEVPNTMLNSNTIDQQKLLGNYYLQISNNDEEIQTNEYETLHINIINTLSMINLDTSVLNPSGSSRLNNSVNLTQDYTNTIANKVRINYSDDTNYTFQLAPSQITESSGVYTYTFVVYAPKTITNVEIISNDEVTTYQTITGTFGVGKYYQITQEVTI